MIHLDTTHLIAVACIFLSGLITLYVTWFTDAFIDREQIRSLPKIEQAKAIPLWVGLITAFGIACILFAIDVLIFRQGLFP
jgi:hypothetical protein